MKKLTYLLAIAVLLLPMAVQAAPPGVAATTPITNNATVDAANIPAPIVSSTVTTNVQTIAGAYYVTVSADIPGAAGQNANIIMTVMNYGNAQDDFTLSIAATNNQAQAGWGTSWIPAATLNNINSGAQTTYTLQVAVDAAATNGAWTEYRIQLSSGNAATAAKSSRYLGDNGSWYGGNMGIAWDGTTTNDNGILVHSVVAQAAQGGAGNDWIRITVQGPVLNITKSIVSVQLNSVASLAVPGATINYRVYVSNSGSQAANDVTISDVIPVNTTFDAVNAAGGTASGFGTYQAAGTVYATNHANGAVGSGETVVLTYSVTID